MYVGIRYHRGDGLGSIFGRLFKAAVPLLKKTPKLWVTKLWKQVWISPKTFAVSGAGKDYIDLFNTYLFVKAHLVNTAGSDLVPDTDVGPVNVWLHSLFSDVSVSLSEKLVSPPTSMYPYRAYIETILSYGPAAKESQLTGVMWYKNTPGQQDKRTTDTRIAGYFGGCKSSRFWLEKVCNKF